MAGSAALPLLLGLLLCQTVPRASTQQEHQERPAERQTERQMERPDEEATSNGRCPANDDKDCPQDATASSVDSNTSVFGVGDRRLNTLLHGKPLVPDEETGDFGFLYARSLSLSVEEDSPYGSPSANVKGRALRNRVFSQTWCSASSCPVSAALTLSNTTTKYSLRKIGQGEALTACLDCSFSAASVSIVDGEAVCASASSTNMPKGVCVAVCQWEGYDCTCSSGCSSNELGSESVHTYGYQVMASTTVRDLLAYLHRLLVRIHNTAEHLNIAAQLDVPGKTRKVRANIEKRFGKEKAQAVPLLYAGTGNAIR